MVQGPWMAENEQRVRAAGMGSEQLERRLVRRWPPGRTKHRARDGADTVSVPFDGHSFEKDFGSCREIRHDRQLRFYVFQDKRTASS